MIPVQIVTRLFLVRQKRLSINLPSGLQKQLLSGDSCHTESDHLHAPLRHSGSSRAYSIVARTGTPAMVQLDEKLLFKARRFIDGADIHRIKGMISNYEQAVELHNRQWPRHESYQSHFEAALREYVFDRQMWELENKNTAALKHANELIAKSKRLRLKGEELAKLKVSRSGSAKK